MFLQSKSNRQRFISYTNTESINFIEINVNNYGFCYKSNILRHGSLFEYPFLIMLKHSFNFQ